MGGSSSSSSSCCCCCCCRERSRAGYERLSGHDDPGDPRATASPREDPDPELQSPTTLLGLQNVGPERPEFAKQEEQQEVEKLAMNVDHRGSAKADGYVQPVLPSCPPVALPAEVPAQDHQRPSAPVVDPMPRGPAVAAAPLPPPPPPPPPPPKPPPMPGMKADVGAIPAWLRPKQRYDKNQATRPVRWKTIAPRDVDRSSVWSSADERRFDNPGLQAHLLRAFGVKQHRRGALAAAPSLAASASASSSSSSSEGSVFSKDVLQTFDILTRSAKVTYDDLAHAALTGDLVSLGHIKSIKGLLLSLQKVSDEQEVALRSRQEQGTPPLKPAELFYLKLVDEGHLSERLRSLLFHFTRAELLGEAARQQGLVLAALVAAASSRGLAELAQLLLFILNFLNEDASSTPAYGFNLCDIDKVSSVRMTDPAECGTLLELVVRECQSSHPHILKVVTELEPVVEAAQVDSKNLKSMIQSLRVDVTNVESDLCALPDSEPHSAFFKAMLPLLQEWKRKLTQLEKGEEDVKAAWTKLRVKFSLTGDAHRELLSSLATFRGDFKKVTDRTKRPGPRRRHEPAR